MNSDYAPRSLTSIEAEGNTSYITGGNPKFVAAYNDCIANVCNFAFQSNSPLINKGVTFSDDYTGLSRPQWEAWDIGAYEY